MIDVSVCYRWEEPPGMSRRFVTRVDMKDPGVQVRSALTGDRLGQARTVTEAARAHGAVAAINGDFFYGARGGNYPLGPVVGAGKIISAPWSKQAVFALNRERSAWAGPAWGLRLGAQAADGQWTSIQAVNDIPGENAMSVFNGQWGDSLSIGAEGCVVAFNNPADGVRQAPDAMGCGLLVNIGIPAGGKILVGRGYAAEWLRVNAPGGLVTGYSFPLGNVDFMVGGSHVLVQNGVPTHLPADAWHPRSMIGMDGAGFLYMVAIEGYGENVGGMTLRELQNYATVLGLTNAINLDGGGSTAMFVKHGIMNYPADGRERAVASIVEVSRAAWPTCRHPFVRC
jgi:exopolysaccharide biosynthesis protein